MNVKPFDYSITITAPGGTGSASTNAQKHTVTQPCRLCNIGVVAPRADATWGIRVKDSEGYLLYEESGKTGNKAILCSSFGQTGFTVEIFDATDGDYAVRVYLLL